MRKLFFCIPLILIISCKTNIDEPELKFEPNSISTIHLAVNQPLKDTIDAKAFAHKILPYGTSRSESIRIKKEGHYWLSMNIDRPTKSFLSIGSNEYTVIVLPNDTSHISLNPIQSNIEIAFTGKGSSLNKYFLEKKSFLGYNDIRSVLNKTMSSSSTYNSIKNAVDSITDVELTFLNHYHQSTALPQWFLDYEKSEIAYAGAGYKVTRPTRNKKVKLFNDQLPKDYFNFLNTIEVDNEKAIFSSYYFLFLDNYFLKDYSFEKNKSLSKLEGVKAYNEHIVDQSKIKLTGQAKNIYHKLKLSQSVRIYSNISQIDSLAKSFQINDYQSLIPQLNKGDLIMDFNLINEKGSTVSFSSFKDKILYINFWATWCGPCIKRIPDLNKMIKKYENDPNITFINICLDSEKYKWNTVVKKNNIAGTNVYADENQSTKLRTLFNIIAIPQYALVNKGNILYENHTDNAPIVIKKIDEILK